MSGLACPHDGPRPLLSIIFDPVILDRKRSMSPMKRAFRDDRTLQALGEAFRAENVDIRFDDFKSAGTGYSKKSGHFSVVIR